MMFDEGRSKSRPVQLATWRNQNDGVSSQQIPEIVQYLESRERRGQRAPRFRWAKRISIPKFAHPLVFLICLFVPRIYVDRHEELQSVIAAETDIFVDSVGRLGAQSAWEAYCQGMVDEWQSASVITALILSAAGSFLGLPNLNNPSRYALLFAILSSLVSIAHSSVYSHVYRSKLSNKHFTIIQLTTYLNYYCFVDNILLSLPLLNLFYAISAFSVSVLLYLWDSSPPGTQWSLATEGRIVIIVIFALQLAFLGLSYLASQELTFTTDELIDASRTRQLTLEMRKEKEADAAQAAVVRNMPVVNNFAYVPVDLPPVKPTARWLGYDWTITDVAVPLGYEDGKPEAYQWEHQQLYVGRIFYEGRYRAGKLGWHIGAKKYMFIPFNKYGAEIMLERKDCDLLCGSHVDFAWYEVKEGEHFDAARASAIIPSSYELLVVNPTSDHGEPAYVAAASFQGGQQLGEVIDGSGHASIGFLGEELRLSPFLVLLIRKGALVSRDTLLIDIPLVDGDGEKDNPEADSSRKPSDAIV